MSYTQERGIVLPKLKLGYFIFFVMCGEATHTKEGHVSAPKFRLRSSNGLNKHIKAVFRIRP